MYPWMTVGMPVPSSTSLAAIPAHGRLPKNPTYKHSPGDRSYTLVFFSTFEVLDLPIKGPMEDAGVVTGKLYEPSPYTLSVRGACPKHYRQPP